MEINTIFAKLDHSHGVFQMSDAIRIAGKLIEKGFSVVAEMAPGAPIDGINLYYLKSTEHDAPEAREALLQILSE